MSNAKVIKEIEGNALAEKEAEEAALWAKIREAVRPGRGEYVTDVISLPSGGHVVGVYKTRASAPTAGTHWTTVYGGRTDSIYYPTDGQAVLALLARRVDDDPNATRHIVRAAARVLGIDK